MQDINSLLVKVSGFECKLNISVGIYLFCGVSLSSDP